MLALLQQYSSLPAITERIKHELKSSVPAARDPEVGLTFWGQAQCGRVAKLGFAGLPLKQGNTKLPQNGWAAFG